MGLQLVKPDDTLVTPTDHPHVSEDTAPLLKDEDPDVTRYVIGVKGSTAAVDFFEWAFLGNVDDDLYAASERGEMGNLTVFGIPEDAIWEVIETFDATADAIGNISITGTVNGEAYSLEVWDGELDDETLAERLAKAE